MNIVLPSHEIIDPIDGDAILRKLELCGRVAYKSEDRITPDSAKRFVAALLRSGYESVIEHVSIRVRFICDRGVTHELVRHRLAAYTQESTRYCNYSKMGMTFIKPCFWADFTEGYWEWMHAMRDAEARYNQLIACGSTPQQARPVLPNSLKTEIICTANLREWRHILRLRTAKDVHPQMRELMLPLLQEFKSRIPIIFDDIEAA